MLNNKYGFINKENEVVISFKYELVYGHGFEAGFARVKRAIKDVEVSIVGMINTQGVILWES